jgi:hypothetical protein
LMPAGGNDVPHRSECGFVGLAFDRLKILKFCYGSGVRG